MVAPKSAILITLASAISFAAATCVHSNPIFGLSLKVYQNEHCITRIKNDHFEFRRASTADKSHKKCQCFDFFSNFHYEVRSLVFIPGRQKNASIHLLEESMCQYPRGADDVYPLILLSVCRRAIYRQNSFTSMVPICVGM
ncbi:hypothetical protein BJ138DRAFT_1154444 [Hygrophoropsis aurantiaca]|uniref:Uncharacterized protein n=1 Tax=Hygrophoropsis aurantiaca TaxID=72124 RepID=A0ACB8A9L8_9AGAM|nr:hypothetical protein BJ138DRAFT_1154444 [Hygrophoropsis aurantiaca]